ncbi:hypothetical protein Mapa_005749 [Marchantia paleacea]|nr:hypothetical protein Mapa_005749 [Marchantia paleacea]
MVRVESIVSCFSEFAISDDLGAQHRVHGLQKPGPSVGPLDVLPSVLHVQIAVGMELAVVFLLFIFGRVYMEDVAQSLGQLAQQGRLELRELLNATGDYSLRLCRQRRSCPASIRG